MTKEDIEKLGITLVEQNGCGIILDITYDDKPIKRIEL